MCASARGKTDLNKPGGHFAVCGVLLCFLALGLCTVCDFGFFCRCLICACNLGGAD